MDGQHKLKFCRTYRPRYVATDRAGRFIRQSFRPRDIRRQSCCTTLDCASMCSKVTRLVDPAFEAIAQWFQHIRIEDMPVTASNKKKGKVISLLPPQRCALCSADLLKTVHLLFCLCSELIFSWLFLRVLFENKI